MNFAAPGRQKYIKTVLIVVSINPDAGRDSQADVSTTHQTKVAQMDGQIFILASFIEPLIHQRWYVH